MLIGCERVEGGCDIVSLRTSLVIGQRQKGEPHREVGRAKVPRQEIIRRSRALLETRDGKPVLVGELAATAEVSERTLRTAFNEYYGVGPVGYQQLRQIYQVHCALRIPMRYRSPMCSCDMVSGRGLKEINLLILAIPRGRGEHK